MLKVVNKRTEEAHEAYLGMSREAYLKELLKENGYKQPGNISQPVFSPCEGYQANEAGQSNVEGNV